ncbi:RNA polymerase sigma factor (sigma-70 family) [Motilibacter peucedani]|uniref:RNA polymerase sigma factor (Sigma-70 family) n=1 Tax=Motilibacter peucedani TaxID=598650 RepID=A0A420XUM8_9ACTN|nr:sigma-70 family RNA polymerase sigma factor [Motilibacter peucedani]RKS80450.1 RNA polymerase sigma factor (sigma-70 family) [Motilibacter peucedani]
MTDEHDVADLVRAARDGDQAAWDALVDRYAGLVWSVVRGYRLASDDASDVFQTAWLRLVEQLPRLREPERVGAWLATTARHECLRVLKSRTRETATDTDVLDLRTDDDSAPPGSDLLRAERDSVLWQCFEASSGPCRQLLGVLIADPPLSYLQVAETLGMPVGSIGPTRRRCLERLRRQLVEAGVDAEA